MTTGAVIVGIAPSERNAEAKDSDRSSVHLPEFLFQRFYPSPNLGGRNCRDA